MVRRLVAHLVSRFILVIRIIADVSSKSPFVQGNSVCLDQRLLIGMAWWFHFQAQKSRHFWRPFEITSKLLRCSVSKHIVTCSKFGKSKCSPGVNSWTSVFLVCINGACSNLLTDVKLFADDTSLFSAVNDASDKFENQSNDLCTAREWNY